MNNSKILTHIPLEKLLVNTPDYVDFKLSKSANKFMKKCFTGTSDLLADDYLHYKDGKPNIVNDWGKTFDMDFGISPEIDYALATILNIKMKWHKKLTEQSLKFNNKNYKAARHNNASETNIPSLYHIPVVEEDLTFFVSTKKLNLDEVNKDIIIKDEIDVTVPLVSLKNTEDLSETFDGTVAIIKDDLYKCDSVKVITEFDMDLSGAEVKQAAVVCMVMASCAVAPKIKKHIIIDKPFYVYTKVNGRLAFSAFISQDSFIV